LTGFVAQPLSGLALLTCRRHHRGIVRTGGAIARCGASWAAWRMPAGVSDGRDGDGGGCGVTLV
jgi:hypothetical protein